MKVEWIANPNKIGDKLVGLVEDLQQSLAEDYIAHGYCRAVVEPEPVAEPVAPAPEPVETREVAEPVEHRMIEHDQTETKGPRKRR